MVGSPERGPGEFCTSSSGYGGRVGIDKFDSMEILALAGSLGDNSSGCRPPVIEDVRGGTAFVGDGEVGISDTLPSERKLFASPWSKRVVSPVFPLPMVLVLVFLGKDDVSPFTSLLDCDCLCRSLCCFCFKPLSSFITISLIRGRYFSKLPTLASWLRVDSRIVRNSSGTLPRSDVSTLMAVKARHAILNSYPSLT